MLGFVVANCLIKHIAMSIILTIQILALGNVR